MARRTADDFVDHARQALGGPDTGLLSDARILSFVNRGQQRVAVMRTHPELSTTTTITTSSGTAAYELTVTNVGRILGVIDTTTDVELTEINFYEYRLWTQGNPSSGKPDYFFPNGVGSNSRVQLTLDPTPDATLSLTVYYQKIPTDLVQSPTATSSVLNEAFDECIYSYAVAQGFMTLQNPQMYEAWMGVFRENYFLADRQTARASDIRTHLRSPIGEALGGA